MTINTTDGVITVYMQDALLQIVSLILTVVAFYTQGNRNSVISILHQITWFLKMCNSRTIEDMTIIFIISNKNHHLYLTFTSSADIHNIISGCWIRKQEDGHWKMCSRPTLPPVRYVNRTINFSQLWFSSHKTSGWTSMLKFMTTLNISLQA